MSALVKSSSFSTLATALIVLNTAVMMLVHYPMSPAFSLFTEAANLLFTLFFAVELALLHHVYGFDAYWSDGFRRFDGVIAILSVVDVVLGGALDSSVLRALRLLRILRILRILRMRASLQQLLAVLTGAGRLARMRTRVHMRACVRVRACFHACMHLHTRVRACMAAYVPACVARRVAVRSALQMWPRCLLLLPSSLTHSLPYLPTGGSPDVASEAIVWLVGLLFLALFIFALLGMELFGGVFTQPAFPAPPRHNFDSITNALITVFIVTSGENWNDIWMDVARASTHPWASVGYFLLLLFSATYLVLNLLTAVVFAAFDVFSTRRRGRPGGMDDSWAVLRSAGELPRSPSTRGRASGRVGVGHVGGGHVGGCCWLPWSGPARRCAEAEARGLALGCLSEAHPLRRLATHLLTYRVDSPGCPALSFDHVVIACIVVSSAILMLGRCDRPPSSDSAALIARVDHVVMLVFIVEMGARIFAFGLLAAPPDQASKFAHLGIDAGPYMSLGWNLLDGTIVLSSILSSFNPAFRTLRVLRVLRPLRLIPRLAGMRRVVELFLRAIPRMGDVFVVYLVLLLLFAVLGVHLFAGQFHDCADAPAGSSGSSSSSSSSALDTRLGCEGEGGRWEAPPFGSFDNVLSSTLLLFEMATLEGWTGAMWAGIDAVGIDMAPVANYAPARSLYFVVWILLGGA